MQILSDLVGKIIITEVKPERPSHAHFLAAMVEQFVSSGKLRIQAEVAKIPLNALVPKIQSLFQGRRLQSRRCWMRHVRISKVEWQTPLVSCAPAARMRPGKTDQIKRALQMALTVARIAGVVSHVHSQESFTKSLYKFSPEH